MGCKSPVRERTSSERQYTNCDLGKQVQVGATAARVIGRGEQCVHRPKTLPASSIFSLTLRGYGQKLQDELPHEKQLHMGVTGTPEPILRLVGCPTGPYFWSRCCWLPGDQATAGGYRAIVGPCPVDRTRTPRSHGFPEMAEIAEQADQAKKYKSADLVRSIMQGNSGWELAGLYFSTARHPPGR